MKIISSKILCLYLSLVGFVSVFTACIIFPEDTVTITGTVAIKRQGEPWNPEHIHYLNTANNQNIININEPRIAARDFIPPPDNNPTIYINESLAKNDIDLAQGKYTWEIQVSPRYIPGPFYFEIGVSMANFYASKTVEILIEDENSEIDLGVIDFDVIRLWGNLPVTFNGEPLSYDGNYSFNEKSLLKFREAGENGIRINTDIESNGNWVQDMYALDTETAFVFSYETCHRGGSFKKELNPDHEIIIYNTDKEIIFPDYPNLDFEATVLKGTVDIFIHESSRYFNYLMDCLIDFYDTEKSESSNISSLETWTFMESENISFNFETWVPAFSFPKTLAFELSHKRIYNKPRVNSSIILTEETDLNNIFLGSFSITPYYNPRSLMK